MLSAYQVLCIERDDGRRHKIDNQRGPGDVSMDRFADPLGSTLDFECNGKECDGTLEGEIIGLLVCI